MDGNAIFKTRQIADDLIKQVLSIWNRSDQKENLEGIEEDPVFRLLVMALAFQFNEIDNDISRLKNEILEDFSEVLVPYDRCRAVPATVVVRTEVDGNYSEVSVDSNSVFTLAGTKVTFVPMFRSRVVKINVDSITKIDGRRWNVSISIPPSVGSLNGVSFCIKNNDFEDLSVSIKNFALPLVKPWDYSNLPWSDCFRISSMVYNKIDVYEATSSWFDLFALQNTRIFFVGDYSVGGVSLAEKKKADLVFEFFGVPSNFTLKEEDIIFNCIPLANVEVRSVEVTPQNPIVKINDNSLANDKIKRQFLFLFNPANDASLECPVDIRKVALDRFNSLNLLKLTSNIVSLFTSDFYAYQNVSSVIEGDKIAKLYSLLRDITGNVKTATTGNASSTCIMLKKGNNRNGNEDGSYIVSYMLTGGASVNTFLSMRSTFAAPPGLSHNRTIQIAEPVYGTDEVLDGNFQKMISDYYMVTRDRLVTPADIQMFCYKELFVSFGISTSMIKSVNVGHKAVVSNVHCGYEIDVDITISNTAYLQRVFGDKVKQAELRLQKKIETRSAGIYPIYVKIILQ
ncbi:MAG TPA: hypothetical protein DDY68_03565 [Porphyromonadaceae bacterium]|nr:hypothetical protein [Porphyromonadaceae bacterium]